MPGSSPGMTSCLVGAEFSRRDNLLSLLAETGAHVIASATDTTEHTTADPVMEALTAHPDVDLLVDLVSFDEPYLLITDKNLPGMNGVELVRRLEESGFSLVGRADGALHLGRLRQRFSEASTTSWRETLT